MGAECYPTLQSSPASRKVSPPMAQVRLRFRHAPARRIPGTRRRPAGPDARATVGRQARRALRRLTGADPRSPTLAQARRHAGIRPFRRPRPSTSLPTGICPERAPATDSGKTAVPSNLTCPPRPVALRRGAMIRPRGLRFVARRAGWDQPKSAPALIGRTQVLGWKAEPRSSEVFKGDATRHRAVRSACPVPVEDERPRRSAGLDGGNHRRPRIVEAVRHTGESRVNIPTAELGGRPNRRGKPSTRTPERSSGARTGKPRERGPSRARCRLRKRRRVAPGRCPHAGSRYRRTSRPSSRPRGRPRA